jgi:hypothetical protein
MILTLYEKHVPFLSHVAYRPLALLPTSELASTAIEKLSGTTLFDKKISLTKAEMRSGFRTDAVLDWGWFKSSSSDVNAIQSRGPAFEPRQNWWHIIREERQLCFSNMVLSYRTNMYQYLYSYNVDYMSTKQVTQNPAPGDTNHLKFVTFTSKDEVRVTQ